MDNKWNKAFNAKTIIHRILSFKHIISFNSHMQWYIELWHRNVTSLHHSGDTEHSQNTVLVKMAESISTVLAFSHDHIKITT